MKKPISKGVIKFVNILIILFIFTGFICLFISDVFNEDVDSPNIFLYLFIGLMSMGMLLLAIFYKPIMKHEQENRKKELNKKISIYKRNMSIYFEKVDYILNKKAKYIKKYRNITLFTRKIFLEDRFLMFLINDEEHKNTLGEMISIYEKEQLNIKNDYNPKNGTICLAMVKQNNINNYDINNLLEVTKQCIYNSIDAEEIKFKLDENYSPPRPPIFIPVIYDKTNNNLYYAKGIFLNSFDYRKGIRLLFKLLK